MIKIHEVVATIALNQKEEEKIKCPAESEIQKEIIARNRKATEEDKIDSELLKYRGDQLHNKKFSIIVY